MYRILTLIIIIFALNATVSAQTGTHTVRLDNRTPEVSYTFEMSVGDWVLVLTETPADTALDTVITLHDPDGNLVAENDDRARHTRDSALGYTAKTPGEFTATIKRFDGSGGSGDLDLTIAVGDESVLEPLKDLSRIDLSGAVETIDSEHFRVHYTTEGADAVTAEYAQAVLDAAEATYAVQVGELGWAAPMSDYGRGGDDRYDIYIADISGAGEAAMGFSSPEFELGDNPGTEAVEQYAVPSFMVIKHDFSSISQHANVDALSLMRTTVAHEFNHALQFGYDMNEKFLWYYEATASWSETAAATADEAASGYVATVYQFPEVCFGMQQGPIGGGLVYGTWIFIDHLEAEYGLEAVQRLWENIAIYEGFGALEATLASYGETMPNMLRSYHLRNLLLDYELADQFNARVFLENTIDDVGRWSFTGRGIQELAANYFALDIDDGTYYVGVVNDDAQLDLTAVGINGEDAEVIPLGRGGNLRVDGYDEVYLLVFNPVYDSNVSDCVYSNYQIDVVAAKGDPTPAAQTLNATKFEPLR